MIMTDKNGQFPLIRNSGARHHNACPMLTDAPARPAEGATYESPSSPYSVACGSDRRDNRDNAFDAGPRGWQLLDLQQVKVLSAQFVVIGIWGRINRSGSLSFRPSP
jgi:hypothetical protein